MGGGLALGKEGPLVHIGACIASLLGQVSIQYLTLLVFFFSMTAFNFLIFKNPNFILYSF